MTNYLHVLLDFKFVVFALLFLFSVVVVSDKNPKTVDIIVEHEPENCYQKAEEGDTLQVHYTGYLESGQVFDSSRAPGRTALSLVLGESSIIAGWTIGLNGMCIGERRKLIIPPHLAYGKAGHPPVIPGDATLTFDVELVDIQSTPIEDVLFRLLRFLVVPVAAICIVMYLYNKYQKFPTKKELKDMKKKKKS